MHKAFKYRLYPNKSQEIILNRTLQFCSYLYNAALQERRDAYKTNKVNISYKGQSCQLPFIKQNNPEYQEIYSQVLQNVLNRIDKAFDNFFRRIKNKETPGYPRFRSSKRYNSFTYPQSGWKLQGNHLILSKIGSLKLKLHRPIQGNIKTIDIKKENDKWYAIFVCETESSPLPQTNKFIGLDVGIESFLVTSDSEFIENPHYLKKSLDKLKDAQKKVSNKKLGSNRRKKSVKLLAKRHNKIKNQRKDFHHKLSRQFINNYDLIAIEKLKISNMIKNHNLAQSISDVGWGQFILLLKQKAEEAAREIIEVNPRYTSQTCSSCGQIVKKDLSERIHICDCGLQIHRDINAAINILRLGMSLQLKN